MHWANVQITNILVIGYRLLYVLFFIVAVVPMGYFEFPTTIPFFGASFSLLLPLLLSRDALIDDDVHKCTLVNLDYGIPFQIFIYLLHNDMEHI